MHRFDVDWGAFGKVVEGNGQAKEGISGCYSVRNSIAPMAAVNLWGRVSLDSTMVRHSRIAELEKMIR
jgi:hypothetical protein